MRDEKEMFDLILNVAQNHPKVTAVLLNGSRANPMVVKDKYQDYDIVYVVDEIEAFINDIHWLDVFGRRVMLQTPETMRNPSNDGTFAFLMLFEDANRIDLTLMPIKNLDVRNLDKMTVILLDKEKRMLHIEPPSDRHFHVQPPSELEYTSCCNNFLWCLQNVAKGIARDELPYAMEMFERIVRDELNSMIEWYIGTLTDFSLSVGKMGKYYKRYLPANIYQWVKETYSDGDYEHLWKSMFIAVDCFEWMAKEVGHWMKVSYNQIDHQNMVNYLIDVKNSMNNEG
jgi:aminoglycoside 6-adenylyltransferase